MYIVEFEGTGVVKIGYTTNLAQRLSQLRSWAGRTNKKLPALTVLATYEGTQELERALHHRFRNRVVRGWEGFEAAWIKASLPLNLDVTLASYRNPWPDDETTEPLPRGYAAPRLSVAEIETACELDARWFAEVNRLQFPAGITRPCFGMLKRPLTDLEVQRLSSHLTGRDNALVWAILGTGLRIPDAATLACGALRGGRVTLQERHLYCSAQARAVLTPYIETLERRAPDAPLFPSRKGSGALQSQAAFDRIALLLKENDVHAEPTSLRMTHAIALWAQGTELAIIAKQLGYMSEEAARQAMAEALI